MASCDKYLDIDPQGSIDKKALQNETGVELLVTAAYASMTEGDGRAEGYSVLCREEIVIREVTLVMGCPCL